MANIRGQKNLVLRLTSDSKLPVIDLAGEKFGVYVGVILPLRQSLEHRVRQTESPPLAVI
jgi:hypothetical protein